LVKRLAAVTSPLQPCGAFHAYIYPSSQAKDKDVLKDSLKMVFAIPMPCEGLGVTKKAFKATGGKISVGGCKITTSAIRKLNPSPNQYFG
jgi:hypothetical protein